jgi:hypothetical protein
MVAQAKAGLGAEDKRAARASKEALGPVETGLAEVGDTGWTQRLMYRR